MTSSYKQAFLILPSQRLISYNQVDRKLKILSKIKAQDRVLSKNGNKLGIIASKTVKSYNLQNRLTQQSQAILQSFFPKKVQGIAFDHADKLIVSDKFGDIYQATPENPVYLNSNLGIPSFLKFIHNPKNHKEYIMLGDDYCKLKIYNYQNMHQVTGIWYIPNSVPLDLLQIDQERFVILVKHEDKDNIKHTYRLYQFSIQNLQECDFNGTLIYSDESEKLNSSQLHPITIIYSKQTQHLYFLKLLPTQIQIISLISQNNLFRYYSTKKQILSQQLKQANWIDCQFVQNNLSKEFILICFGQYYNREEQTIEDQQIQFSFLHENKSQKSQIHKINEREFIMKCNIE